MISDKLKASVGVHVQNRLQLLARAAALHFDVPSHLYKANQLQGGQSAEALPLRRGLTWRECVLEHLVDVHTARTNQSHTTRAAVCR